MGNVIGKCLSVRKATPKGNCAYVVLVLLALFWHPLPYGRANLSRPHNEFTGHARQSISDQFLFYCCWSSAETVARCMSR